MKVLLSLAVLLSFQVSNAAEITTEVRVALPVVGTNQVISDSSNTIKIEHVNQGRLQIVYTFNSAGYTQFRWLNILQSLSNIETKCKYDMATMNSVLRKNSDPGTDVRVVPGVRTNQLLSKNTNYEVIHDVGDCPALSMSVNSLFWLGNDSEANLDPKFAIACESQKHQSVVFFLSSFYVGGPSYKLFTGDDLVCGEEVTMPIARENNNSYDGFHSWKMNGGAGTSQRTFKFSAVNGVGVFSCEKYGVTKISDSLFRCESKVLDFTPFKSL